jgi:inosose dehydratase
VNSRVRLREAKVGIVPLNWKYDAAHKESFLRRISEFGFKGIQVSCEQSESAEFRGLMKKYEIEAAEIYVPIRCSVNGVLPGEDEEVEKILTSGAQSKVQNAVFAIDGSKDRDESAANADAGPGFTDAGFKSVADFVEKWAVRAHELGMASSFHPHGGTYIETPRETKILISLLSEKVSLCLDVGHWLVGGGDPVAAVREYGNRVTHVHVKDVNGEVLQKMKSKEVPNMGYAVDELKLFVPAGTGLLKVRELFIALEESGFSGWLMSEQDTAWEPTEEKSAESMANIQIALTS